MELEEKLIDTNKQISFGNARSSESMVMVLVIYSSSLVIMYDFVQTDK